MSRKIKLLFLVSRTKCYVSTNSSFYLYFGVVCSCGSQFLCRKKQKKITYQLLIHWMVWGVFSISPLGIFVEVSSVFLPFKATYHMMKATSYPLLQLFSCLIFFIYFSLQTKRLQGESNTSEEMMSESSVNNLMYLLLNFSFLFGSLQTEGIGSLCMAQFPIEQFIPRP